MKKAISYKFIYTLGIILLVRLVAHIPVPWVDAELMQSASTYTFFDFTNLFSGGAFSNFTFGAIGVSSYISATIIFQILAFFYFSSTKDSAIRSKPKRCKKNTYDNRRLSRFYKFVNYDFFS